jgi:uncharacterized protein (TIGR00725 family)
MFKIAVLGSASSTEGSPEERKAFAIGAEVAMRGGVVLTGACPGLPLAAARGAQSAHGTAIGISPAMNRQEHRLVYGYPESSDVLLFTGMGTKGRNIVLVRSADACVFIGGRIGTLNEFTIAYDELCETCAIAVLTGTGGLSDEYLRIAQSAGKNTRAHMLAHADPKILIEQVFRFLGS